MLRQNETNLKLKTQKHIYSAGPFYPFYNTRKVELCYEYTKVYSLQGKTDIFHDCTLIYLLG